LNDEEMENIVEVEKNTEDDVPFKWEGNVTPHF
jgi:hypothetical protein